ncbi:MAG TPA: Do family serine endopeptidase [Xanthobacteraceae bacterium]|jgi:serine protease Do|nr:Do family serine endopeptidase [Xanthobacteraceae bacterium]
MNPNNAFRPTSGKVLAARRLTLLASVAGIGLAVLLGGPGYRSPTALTSPAQAAETVQHPAGFADLVAKVKPAVVSVRVKIDQSSTTSMNENGNDKTPFDQFFRQFGFENGQGALQPRHRVVTGEGSGFFISADGYAVTNNHVVDHAKTVQVTTDDGTKYTAKVVGTDPKTDLALIKVDGKSDFPYVKFADRAPRVGDWVVAVGNPFGLGGTVTAGIVSARGRDIGSGPYDDYIQIDAPINKGNSGGPAFDIDGNVIGVNTAIFSPSGGSVGIGFDIPADTAKLVVAQLESKGYVTRGWMGVQIQQVTPEIADSLGMKKVAGALVDEPQPNSPAAKAGIAAGDVITAVNGKPIKGSRELAREVGMMPPGTSVKFDLLHQGATKNVTLTLGEMPRDQQANANEPTPAQDEPHLGLALAPANEVTGAGAQGVAVVGVEPGSPAADHGFKTGDVILQVGGKAVSSVNDVRGALEGALASGKRDVLMRVKTADGARFIAMPVAQG